MCNQYFPGRLDRFCAEKNFGGNSPFNTAQKQKQNLFQQQQHNDRRKQFNRTRELSRGELPLLSCLSNFLIWTTATARATRQQHLFSCQTLVHPWWTTARNQNIFFKSWPTSSSLVFLSLSLSLSLARFLVFSFFQPYFTINPAMFDHQTWDYKSLQKLCKTLNLKQTGQRGQLIKRLQEFHKEHASSRFGAGAFANIGVQVYTSPTKSKARVSQKFLSPCINRSNGEPILKHESCYPYDISEMASTARTPIRSSSKPPRTPKSSARRIAFSPYNQVRIIPHRLDHLKGSPVSRALDMSED